MTPGVTGFFMLSAWGHGLLKLPRVWSLLPGILLTCVPLGDHDRSPHGLRMAWHVRRMTAPVRDKGPVQATAALVRVVKGGFMSLGTASVRPPGRRMQSRRALAALAASALVAALAVTAVAAPAHASSGDRMAYVTNTQSNSVSVIDTTTRTVTATIPVGADPIAAAVSPDGSTVYVANEGGNSVSVINAATDTVTATIAVGVGPDAVAVSPDGSLLYVGCDISLGPA